VERIESTWQKCGVQAKSTFSAFSHMACRVTSQRCGIFSSKNYRQAILDIDTHTHIQGVKGIQRKQARNIDARRDRARVGYKKAQGR
jgi:hypothetical protein